MTTLETIIKGFNAGYLLQKFQPNLSLDLAAGLRLENNPFILGFLLGRKEYLQEIGLYISPEEDISGQNLEVGGEEQEPDL